MKWEYEINKEDEYMMKCNHVWVDEPLDYYPEVWDNTLETHIITLAFSHCKMCGAQRSKVRIGDE